MNNDSMKKTLFVAFCLCVVCSVLVSSSAVLLKPRQEKNKKLDIQKNLLLASGLIESSKVSESQVASIMKNFQVKLIDLDNGTEVTEMDATSFDQKKAAKDPKLNKVIDGKADIAKIKTRSKYGKVYLYQENGSTSMIVLPIHGKGLWSTLYGFIVLDSAAEMVKGLAFYEHGETPGLGGEVDNPRWKAQWKGKKIFKDGMVNLGVIKGTVNPNSANAAYEVDGLSGATITSVGVSNLVRYWLGSDGFLKYINNLKGN